MFLINKNNICVMSLSKKKKKDSKLSAKATQYFTAVYLPSEENQYNIFLSSLFIFLINLICS